MEIVLEKFSLNDESRLKEIVELNSDAAGSRRKDYKKFIEWNSKAEYDPYWKIMFGDTMVGYIGYDDATRKPTTKKFAKSGSLYLEIYLDPEFTGKGIGQKAFEKSLEMVKEPRFTVYASTYIANTKAQKFFQERLGMKFVKFDKKFNVVIFSLDYERY